MVLWHLLGGWSTSLCGPVEEKRRKVISLRVWCYFSSAITSYFCLIITGEKPFIQVNLAGVDYIVLFCYKLIDVVFICWVVTYNHLSSLQRWLYCREHLKYLWNVYRVVTSHLRDLHTTETTGHEWFPSGHGTNYFRFVSTFSFFFK